MCNGQKEKGAELRVAERDGTSNVEVEVTGVGGQGSMLMVGGPDRVVCSRLELNWVCPQMTAQNHDHPGSRRQQVSDEVLLIFGAMPTHLFPIQKSF